MRLRNHCLSVSVSAAVAAVLACHAPVVQAAETPRFVLPSQPLGDALRAVGAQSSLNIVFDSGMVDGRTAPAIDARLSPEQAVARLLEGTGISHRFLDGNTLVLSMKPAPRISATDASEAKPIRLAQTDAAQAPAEPADSLEEVVVRGLVFKYDEVETANKMGLSVKDTPQSVKVITADVLEFSHVEKFEDSYKLDAGSFTSHSQDQFVRTYLRGFQLSAPKVDGFRTSNYPTLDLAPFERFEIIKGATSTIYGQSPVGGTLNAVSKKPLAEWGGEASLEGGNFGHMRGDFDMYGPLTDRLSYRVVAAYLDEDSFLDLAFNERKVFAPSLKYDFSNRTSVTVMVQYQDAEFLSSYGSGLQYVGSLEDPYSDTDPRNFRVPDVPRSRIAVNPDGLSDREFLMTRVYLEHQFANDWTLRANLQDIQIDVVNRGSYAYGLISSDGFSPVYMYIRDAEEENFSGEVNLFGNVEAFGREHTLFVGMDHRRSMGLQLSGFGSALDPDGAGFNIYDPDYSVFVPFPDSPGAYPGIFNGRDLTIEYGITGQALLRATDKLSFMLGTRYSHVEIGQIFSFDAAELSHVIGDADRYTNSATTFQGGITYALSEAVNLYASYGETFTPRNERTGPTSRVGPEEGVAYEVGAKGDALGRRLSWSTALFDIARTNISQPLSPDSPYVRLLGEQRARGVEFDVQGKLTDGWDIYASAAWLNNEFTEGQFENLHSFLAPKMGLSLFTSYEFQGGSLDGFGLGGGVVYKKRGEFVPPDGSPISGDFAHIFDDVLEVDLRAYYRRGHWDFELSATNVLGDEYFSPVENALNYGIGVNPGTQVMGKAAYKF
jgi:TonB-dependent siderophore receptor